MSKSPVKNPNLNDAIDFLRKLVAFDTTSRNSNLELIEWVEAYLKSFGARTQKIYNDEGNKANLIASFGPDIDGGIIYSGHSDVVPIDGQDWDTNPWDLTLKEDKLYGRGTCDMKGFSACVLAIIPEIAKADLKKPIHYALSYDEEVGCLGAPRMVEYIANNYPKIDAVIIGEPTDMKTVSGHKGIASYIIEVTGKEAHSSRTDMGISAIMAAIPLMEKIKALSSIPNGESPYIPTGTSMNINIIEGGTAVNILSKTCRFIFDIRFEPDFDLESLVKQISLEVSKLDIELKNMFPECGAQITKRSYTPGLNIKPNSNAEVLSRNITGDNEIIAVSYAAEAGIFQKYNMDTIICGPGSILQAHQKNEYVEVAQLNECLNYLEKTIELQKN